jgi:hypothetical protein
MSPDSDEMGIIGKLLISSASLPEGLHLKILMFDPIFSPLSVSEAFAAPKQHLNAARMGSKVSKMAIKVFDFSIAE